METHRKFKTYELTWYINPHLFWLRTRVIPDDVVQMEQEMNEWYQTHSKIQNKRFKPQIGEMVAYYNPVIHSWFRGVVDYKYNAIENWKETYIIWLVDRGYPIYATSLLIRKLERDFTDRPLSENVWKVGVSYVMPTTERYDYMRERAYMVKNDKWMDITARKFKEILSNANCIKFRPEYCVDDHYFGEMWIQGQEEIFRNAIDCLLELGNAEETAKNVEFLDELSKASTVNIERYQDNDHRKIEPIQIHSQIDANELGIDQNWKNRTKKINLNENLDDFPCENSPQNTTREMHYYDKVTRWLDKYCIVPEENKETREEKVEMMPVLKAMKSFTLKNEPKIAPLRKFASYNQQSLNFDSKEESDTPDVKTVVKRDTTRDVAAVNNLLKKIREKEEARKALEEPKEPKRNLNIFPAGYQVERNNRKSVNKYQMKKI